MPRPYLALGGTENKMDPAALLQAAVAKEFYNAQACLQGDLRRVQLDHAKAIGGSVRIFRTSHRGSGRCTVRRSWQDIRADSKQFFIVWFPTIGSIAIHQGNRVEIIDRNSFGISYSNKPFEIETLPDENNAHESYQVAIPAHHTNSFLPSLEKASGRRYGIEAGDSSYARHTFIQLFTESEKMSDRAALSYANASFEALVEILKSDCDRSVEESHIKHVRLQAVLTYIDFHLSDPGLTASRVSSECDISSRYLHCLFKKSGTSFHDYVWNKRLARANEWLRNDGEGKQTISHVAANVGFRSISHFSRVFKEAFGYSPSQARKVSLTLQ